MRTNHTRLSHTTHKRNVSSTTDRIRGRDDDFLPFEKDKLDGGPPAQTANLDESQSSIGSTPKYARHSIVARAKLNDRINLNLGGTNIRKNNERSSSAPLHKSKSAIGNYTSRTDASTAETANSGRHLRSFAPEQDQQPLSFPAGSTSAPEKYRRKPRRLFPDSEPWQVQKESLLQKLDGQAWSPRKRLSPETVEGIRTLHARDPNTYTTAFLAQEFKISPDAIRRILRSKWRPNEKEEEDRKARWEKRGETIWSNLAKEGFNPPKKWRAKGIRLPQGRFGSRPQRSVKPGNTDQPIGVWVGEEGYAEPQVSLASKIL